VGLTAIWLETYYTQHLTSYAQRAGPRFVQSPIESAYLRYRVRPRSDPGLDLGLDPGFATLGIPHTDTHMLGHVA